jgi:thiamine-phosphate pyrophosphorylase
MKVHAIVDNLADAQAAVRAGATVVQLRRKVPTDELIACGWGFRSLPVTFVVNDDVDAALELRADGVHLGQSDLGADRARKHGLILGRSASTFEEAVAADADYIGVGPVWATPSKADAAEPLGLDELRRICAAVTTPVVAIGGIDARNAAACIAAGAVGVAVLRAATDPSIRRLVDEARKGSGVIESDASS